MKEKTAELLPLKWCEKIGQYHKLRSSKYSIFKYNKVFLIQFLVISAVCFSTMFYFYHFYVWRFNLSKENLFFYMYSQSIVSMEQNYERLLEKKMEVGWKVLLERVWELSDIIFSTKIISEKSYLFTYYLQILFPRKGLCRRNSTKLCFVLITTFHMRETGN